MAEAVTTIQIRLLANEAQVVKEAATEAGFDSTSAYIRAVLGLRVPSVPGMVAQAALDRGEPMRESVKTVESIPTAQCRAKRHHRKGTFCGACNNVATKDGE